MVSDQSLSLLAQIIGQIGQIQPNNQNLMARQILLHSQIDFDAANYRKSSGSGGPSVVSRIFDILSRPNYAVANAYKPLIHDVARHDWKQALIHAIPGFGGQAGPMWRGITGQEKNTFTQLLTKDPEIQGTKMGDLPGPLKAALGLTLDIGLDPTTYIGVGGFKSGAKGLKAVEGLQSVRQGAVEAEQLSNTKNILEAAGRASGAMPEGSTAIPALKAAQSSYGPVRGIAPSSVKYSPQAASGLKDLAEKMAAGGYKPLEVKAASKKYGADFTNAMKYAQHANKVSRAPGFYGQVARAEKLVERIASAEPSAVMRAAPKPHSGLRITPAEQSLSIIAARDALKKMKLGPQKALDPKQQLTMFKTLLMKTSGTPRDRMAKTVGMLRASEKYFESQGASFKFWDGTHVKLSEVFDEIGDVGKVGPQLLKEYETGKITSPILDQAVEAVRARSAMGDSRYVQLGLDQTTAKAAQAVSSLSPNRAASVLGNLGRELSAGLRGASVSPAGISTARGLFKSVLASQAPPIQKAFSVTSKTAHDIMMGRASAQAKVDRDILIKKQIERHLKSPYLSVATKLGDKNKAIEFMGMQFAAHYGYSDLRPIAQDYLLSAQANASVRSRHLATIAKATTPEGRREAFRAAQLMGDATKLPPNLDARTLAVAGDMRNMIDELFSSTGVVDTANSVATRAAFVMDDINAELRKIGSSFQFTKGKVTDELGEVTSYGNGIDWLKSWEAHKPLPKEEPLELISKLQVATEKVSKRYALLDEVANRFGTPLRQGANQYKAADPRLAGHYFTKESVAQINRMNEALKNAYNPKDPWVKQLDRVISTWKSGVTIYAPSHHIRNLIGDTWLSWIAGVNSPRPYLAARQVLQSQRKAYGDSLASTARLVNPEAEAAALARPGHKVVTTRAGIPLTADQIYISAHRRGLLLSARQVEDVYGEPLMPKIAGGHVQGFARGATELREHYVRLAHYIDHISKSKNPNLKQVFDEAAHTVRKWHPDGMDLTNFERRYMRRIFPFYSWVRKAFPLVMEAMVMKPGKIVAAPKTVEAIQAAVGIEATRADPFPADQMFPSWLKEKGIGPIAATNGPLGFLAAMSRQGVDKDTGQPIGGYSILNPSNPMIDMVSQFAGAGNPRAPLQGVGSALNPLAKIPIELTTDKQLFTDVPVSYDPNRYATEQIPGGGILSRITNMGILGPTERGKREGLGNLESFINYGTGAGLQGTGPYIQQANRESIKRRSEERRKRIQDLINGNY